MVNQPPATRGKKRYLAVCMYVYFRLQLEEDVVGYFEPFPKQRIMILPEEYIYIYIYEIRFPRGNPIYARSKFVPSDYKDDLD